VEFRFKIEKKGIQQLLAHGTDAWDQEETIQRGCAPSVGLVKRKGGRRRCQKDDLNRKRRVFLIKGRGESSKKLKEGVVKLA